MKDAPIRLEAWYNVQTYKCAARGMKEKQTSQITTMLDKPIKLSQGLTLSLNSVFSRN